MSQDAIRIERLGQSGLRISHLGSTFYVDPYLSNSVSRLHDKGLQRLCEIPIMPSKVTDADIILITHSHTDHCDPDTLPAIAKASPNARFLGPSDVHELLFEWGVERHRLVLASDTFQTLSAAVEVKAVPAAHPKLERDAAGNPVCVGYVLQYGDRNIYIAGDTSITVEIIEQISCLGPFDLAILPVNERNFFRDQAGIIGNMSVREAFQLSDIIGAKRVMPVHWDMFEQNEVDPSEIKAVYAAHHWEFQLVMAEVFEL